MAVKPRKWSVPSSKIAPLIETPNEKIPHCFLVNTYLLGSASERTAIKFLGLPEARSKKH
jgi:hypothetical protein